MQKSYLLGFVGIILVAVIIALILNYFKIITFPNISLGNLNLFSKTSSSLPPADPGLPFDCPVEISPCPEAETIDQGLKVSKSTPEGFRGLGFSNLVPDTVVLAMISGQYEFRKVGQSLDNPNGDELINFTITNQEFEASYLITGGVPDLPEKGMVVKDQPIAILSGGSRGMNSFNKLFNLVISIKDLKAGQYLKLKPSDDGLIPE